jgi:hypothetical protein
MTAKETFRDDLAMLIAAVLMVPLWLATTAWIMIKSVMEWKPKTKTRKR